MLLTALDTERPINGQRYLSRPRAPAGRAQPTQRGCIPGSAPHGPSSAAGAASLIRVRSAGQELLAAERDAVLREAVTRLPPCRQRLIAMLTEDPPVPYAQISATLRIPVGSIGPSRVRCLDKLRRDPAIAAVINPTPHPRQASSPGRQLR
jgi:DNA-directed RNA polymerase specialized sigma24 family protein